MQQEEDEEDEEDEEIYPITQPPSPTDVIEHFFATSQPPSPERDEYPENNNNIFNDPNFNPPSPVYVEPVLVGYETFHNRHHGINQYNFFRWAYQNVFVRNRGQPNQEVMLAWNPDVANNRGYIRQSIYGRNYRPAHDPMNGLLWDFNNPNTWPPEELRIDNLREFYTLVNIARNRTSEWQDRNPPYGTVFNQYNVTLRYWSNDGEPYFKTFNWTELETFREFKERVDHFMDEYTYDKVHPDVEIANPLFEGYVDMSWIEISYSALLPEGNRNVPQLNSENHKYMVYESKAQDGRNTCVYQSLLDCDIERRVISEMFHCTDLFELKRFIVANGLKINIVYNIPEFDDVLHYRNDFVRIRLKGRNNVQRFHKLQTKDVKYIYFLKTEGATESLICNIEHCHIEKSIHLKPEVCNNVYASAYEIIKRNGNENLVIRDYAKIIRPPIPDVIEEKDTRFVFFDFECLVDYTEYCRSKPYSVSFSILKWDDLKELDSLECNYVEELKDRFIVDKVRSHTSYNCAYEFLGRLKEAIMDTSNPLIRFILVGFNNAKYDNFMLLYHLNSFCSTTRSSHAVNYPEYNGINTIGNIYFFDNRCEVFDLRRHLSTGSLSKLCENFNIVHFAKKGDLISHKEVQCIYNRNEPSQFYEKLHDKINIQTLIEYNNYDVLSLALLFYRYVKFMGEFECVKTATEDKTVKNPMKPIYYYCSMPSYMYKLETFFAEKADIDLGKITYPQYCMIRQALVAGRIDVFGKRQKKYEGELMALDVKSMYPYVMFIYPCYFPVGSPREFKMTIKYAQELVDEFDKTKTFEKIGWYNVDIDQSNLVHKDLPLIRCYKSDAGNDWDYSEESIIQKGIILSSIDILTLLEFESKVVFNIGKDALVFDKKVRNYEIFGFLKEFMIAKNEQDKKKHNKDPTFNSSIRSLGKDCPNALSGKNAQKVFDTGIDVVTTERYYSRLTRTTKMAPGSETVIGMFGKDKVIMHYKLLNEKKENIKPLHIGSLIYAYSRYYVYKHLLSKLGMSKCIYHDTDSVKFSVTDFQVVEEYLKSVIIPHNECMEVVDPSLKDTVLFDKEKPAQVFGCFEDELVEGNNLTFINDKKEWACFKIDPITDDILWSVYKLKGVSPRSILIDNVNGEEERKFIARKLIFGGHGVNTLGDMRVYNEGEALKYDMQYTDEKSFSKPKVARIVFNNLIEGNCVYLMNAQFKRTIKTTDIIVKYMVKKISPALLKNQ